MINYAKTRMFFLVTAQQPGLVSATISDQILAL